MDNYYLFFLLAFISEIIGTISGFGSSIVFVPIASIFFDFHTVLGITAIFHVFSNISKILLFRKGFDKNIVLKLGIPAVLSVALGAFITTLIEVKAMELLMSLALIGLSTYLLFNINKEVKKTNSNLIIGGGISGFLAGLVGTGGAVRGLVILAFNLPKDIFITTSAIIDLGVDLSRSAIYVANGYFPRNLIWIVPFLVAVSLAGSYIGKMILKHTSERVFRYLVVSLILATSAFHTYRYVTTRFSEKDDKAAALFTIAYRQYTVISCSFWSAS